MMDEKSRATLALAPCSPAQSLRKSGSARSYRPRRASAARSPRKDFLGLAQNNPIAFDFTSLLSGGYGNKRNAKDCRRRPNLVP